MATYRYVAYNIQQSYKKTYDDSDLSMNQILFWINVIVARLRKENEKEIEQGKFLTRFCEVPVQIDTDCHDRKYVDIPVDVADMDNDKGIQYITYNYESKCCCTGANFAQVIFQPTSPMKAFRLNMDEYEKPSPKNPYFYRLTGVDECDNVNRIYFLGLECITVKDVELGLICNVNSNESCDLDSEISLPEYLIEDLITRVLNLGRFLLIAPQENVNEGSDLTNRFQQNTPTTTPPPPTDEQIAQAQTLQNQRRENIQNMMSNEQQ
jgi:hypothetical protein